MEADSTESRLVFREPGSGAGEATDGNGPYLDNIRVFSVAPGTDSLTVDTNGPLEGRDSTAAFLRIVTFNDYQFSIGIGEHHHV